MSHPAWVCGLKLGVISDKNFAQPSHPAWVCGLKPKKITKGNKDIRHTLRGCVD